jgi:hypothetical protein
MGWRTVLEEINKIKIENGEEPIASELLNDITQ